VSSVRVKPRGAKGKQTRWPQASASARHGGWLASERQRTLASAIVLVIATVALYFPVHGHPFVNYDDDIYVRFNPHITSGLSWETLRWSFTSFYASNWHPLTWLSHAADYQLFGLNAGAHHDVNLLLHLCNVLLLFWVLWQATGEIGRSCMVAALFALHPVNVETVAWVAERKSLLSMLFFLLALGAYRWYTVWPKVTRYTVVALLFAMGLMAKPQIITLPLVLLLWDYWPLRRMASDGEDLPLRGKTGFIGRSIIASLLLEKLPLLMLSGVSAVLTIRAQRAAGALGGINFQPFRVRLENAIVAYVEYFRQFLWPERLVPLYPHPGNSLSAIKVLAAAAVLVAITGLVWVNRRHRYLLVGWLWFLGTMVPMIGLVQAGVQARADRYAYLPFIGLFIAATWGIADWFYYKKKPSSWPAAAGVVVALLLAVYAHRQIAYWQDSVTLWSHTLEVTDRNWVAENNLAHGYLDEGDEEKALAHFRAALDINPSHADSNLSVGAYEQGHGDLAGAIAQYQKVISLTQNTQELEGPSREKAFRNMGMAYRELHDYARSRQSFQSAVELNPQDASAWLGLGAAAQKMNDPQAAVAAYSQVVKLEPTDVAYLILAKAAQQVGDEKLAEEAMQRARAMSLNFEQTQQSAARILGQ
jgi:tetratricopeptide (TPR) repeat protein